MGKSNGKKKKKQAADKSVVLTPKQNGTADHSTKAYDNDTAVFIAMSHELKEEGNKLFQRRDCEGALLKYEKALKLLPRNHVDVAHLRSNMATCYMQMGISNYPRAVHQCNLALEVVPKYSKALIKRARCYEGLNRLELALRDLNTVLSLEPSNLTALELAEKVMLAIERIGNRTFDHPVPEYGESPYDAPSQRDGKDKSRKTEQNEVKRPEQILVRKTSEENYMEKVVDKETKVKVDKKSNNKEPRMNMEIKASENKEDMEQRKVDDLVEKNIHNKALIDEAISNAAGEELTKYVKLVLGDDIRWAQLPANCSLLKLREIIQDRFPASGAVLVKYKDEEGDMITITTSEELRWAESSASAQASVKLYIVEVSPELDLFHYKLKGVDTHETVTDITMNKKVRGKVKDQGSLCIEEWIVQFAKLFKNYVGLSCDAFLDLHELGSKLYSEAMEETVTSEEAMLYFDLAAENFQEMVALALFNWGNVHMARARKKIQFTEDLTDGTTLGLVKDAYEWAQKEYNKSGKKYIEALEVMPNFYEGYLALALQQFEQAKLAWNYAVARNVDLDTWSSAEVLDLYNSAEENIEKGTKLWDEYHQEGLQSKHLVTRRSNALAELQNMGFELEDLSESDSEEKATTVRSQINILWGTMLYERSLMEFKLDLPVWHECLEASVEKFVLAGAPPTDIAVMIKNHCSNDAALEGLGFRIDDIVQAWHDMDEAKRWYMGVPSFRLEPLLRRRVSKIYDALEHL